MELTALTAKYQLRLLLTFGSYGTDRFTSESDLDVAYDASADLSLDDQHALLMDLIRYFQRDRIDLVDLKRAGPLLAYEIACHGKPLYQVEPDGFLKFKLKASARYADTRHLRQARKVWLNEQLETKERRAGGGR